MIESLKGTVTAKDWMAVAVMLAITAALCVGFMLFVKSGQEEDLLAVNTETATIVANLAEAQTKAKNIEALRQETAKIDRLVGEFQSRLPTTADIAGFVGQFQEIAREVGELELELTKLAPIKDPQLPKETIPYKITVYGSFHKITSFINRLERFERYLKVSDLNIDQEKSGISKATFTLSTFRFIEESAGAV